MDNVIRYDMKQELANLNHIATIQTATISHLQKYCTELEQKIKHLELIITNVNSLDIIPQKGPIRGL